MVQKIVITIENVFKLHRNQPCKEKVGTVGIVYCKLETQKTISGLLDKTYPTSQCWLTKKVRRHGEVGQNTRPVGQV